MPLLEETSELALPRRRLRLPVNGAAIRTEETVPAVREMKYGSTDHWPTEAAFILSALDAGHAPLADRRLVDRTLYHVVGELRLFSDDRSRSPWVIYTRDVTPRSVGFITRHRLPLGYGGTLTLQGPRGEELTIDCTVRRCRQTVNGWYDGALSLNREQWPLARDNFQEAPLS